MHHTRNFKKSNRYENIISLNNLVPQPKNKLKTASIQIDSGFYTQNIQQFPFCQSLMTSEIYMQYCQIKNVNPFNKVFSWLGSLSSTPVCIRLQICTQDMLHEFRT